MSEKYGSGSLTAMPVIETQAGDISAYIPTNVISITDGQIFLETNLFYQGVRPAVNVGISVSRVGSAAQIKAMKQVSGSMKLDLAQYREMAAFSQFSADLDKSTKQLLDKGAKLTELLKQPVHCPMETEDEIVSIFAGVKGYLSEIKVTDVKDFEAQSLKHMHTVHPEYFDEIAEKKVISPELEAKLHEFFKSFVAEYLKNKEKAA